MSGALRSLRTASGWGIENRFFTEQRILVCASTGAIAYAFGLAWRLFLNRSYLASSGKPCVDFTSLWITGTFAGSSDPARMYDDSAWAVAWNSLTGMALSDCVLAQGHTSYPPILLFFTYPLALMPYSIAFAAWMAATLMLYLLAVYLIIPRPAAVIAALTPYTLVFNVLSGHDGFLTAGLVGLSLVFIERRPWLSGVFLGLLTYKPQFGILFPLALLASRNWRALASATAASLVLGLAAALAFGYQVWPLFVTSLVDRPPDLSAGPWWLVSVFGFLHSAGASTQISWLVHLTVAALISAATCVIWSKRIPFSLKAALLCVASVTVTPYVLRYDLCILTIAAGFLVKDGLARGFLPGERALVLTCWGGLLVVGTAPIPTIICVVLLILVVRRILLHRGEPLAAPRPLLQPR